MSVLSTGIRIDRRDLVILSVIHLVFLTWYYRFSVYVLRFIVGPEAFTIHYIGFNLVTALTLNLAALFVHKMNAIRGLCLWSILTAIGTASILLTSGIFWRLSFYYLLAGLFGVCQLTFYAYFWSLTAIEERGRIGGLLAAVSLAILPFTTSVTEQLDFLWTAALSIVDCLGVLVIGLFSPKEASMSKIRESKKDTYPEQRTFLLYLIPWIIYSLVNATFQRNITYNTFQNLSDSAKVPIVFLQIIGACLGAATGGLVADFFGRKASLAVGLTLYGFSTALSGTVSTYEVVVLAHFVNGLNWGIFLTLYQLVIWGDLANARNYARRYSLGFGIFYLSTGLGEIFVPTALQLPLAVASLSSCLLIFLSNVPLILAPELLPSSFREKIRLKLYVHLLRKRSPATSAGQG